MKKGILKKTVVIALSLILVVGTLVGCKGEENPAETEGLANEDGETNEENVTPGIDGWKAFSDNVTLQVAVYDRGAQGIDPVTDNGYTRYVQENFGDKYNITVEFVPISRNDVMTDYALLSSGGDLPTILMEYDYPKVTQWANDGYLQSIDLDEFAKVAPTYYQRMVDLEQIEYTIVNDETYFVLAERPYYDTTYTYVTFCRMDWLREVGYDQVPQNYEEYTDALQKIIDAGISEHPAGGSMKFAASHFNAEAEYFSFREDPIDEEDWVQHSTLSTPAFSWEPTKEAIRRINAEYNAGYMDPEYFTIDAEMEKANFINGKQFAYSGYMASRVDWLESFYDANPDAELAILYDERLVEEGVVDYVQMRSNNPYGMTIGFGNNASENELKAAWMYLEWSTLNIEELQSHPEDWNNFNNSKDYWCVTIESVQEDTIDEAIASITPEGIPQDFTQDLLDYYYYLKEIADNGHAYTDPQFAVAIKSEAEYSATLLSLAVEYYDTLVMCDPDEFDDQYEKLSQAYLDAGYQEVIDERLEAYKAGNTTKLY